MPRDKECKQNTNRLANLSKSVEFNLKSMVKKGICESWNLRKDPEESVDSLDPKYPSEFCVVLGEGLQESITTISEMYKEI